MTARSACFLAIENSPNLVTGTSVSSTVDDPRQFRITLASHNTFGMLPNWSSDFLASLGFVGGKLLRESVLGQ